MGVANSGKFEMQLIINFPDRYLLFSYKCDQVSLSSDSINGTNLSLKKKQSAPPPKIVSACGWGDEEDVPSKRVFSKP